MAEQKHITEWTRNGGNCSNSKRSHWRNATSETNCLAGHPARSKMYVLAILAVLALAYYLIVFFVSQLMHQIQLVFRRWSTSAFYRRPFHGTPKSRIASWAWTFWKSWPSARNRRAKLLTAASFTMHWYGGTVNNTAPDKPTILNAILFVRFRHFSSNLVKNRGHACCHAVFYSVYIFRNQILYSARRW